MTPEEVAVLAHLSNAFRAFQALPVMVDMDLGEFVDGIHKAQNVVLARAGLRALKALGASNT